MKTHHNNVGVLRLLFASLVIVAHSAEMIDGDGRREPLHMLTHTLDFGTFAVDGFFLLSGFLIAQSMVRSSSVWTYLWRRVLRIYPAFVVAYLLCVFVLGPLVGAQNLLRPGTLAYLVTLNMPPAFVGQLEGLHYPALNGAMWTIAYEFRCYLMVALLGVTGLLAKRRFILGLTVAFLVGMVVTGLPQIRAHVEPLGENKLIGLIVQNPVESLRLTAFFLVGTSIYLFWDEIAARLNGAMAAVCFAMAALLSLRPETAQLGLATAGGLALFWLALKANLGPVQKVNDSWDISYGVYLYGWPIGTAVLWWNRGIQPLPLTLVTLTLAALAGAVSWIVVERWTKGLPFPARLQRLLKPARVVAADPNPS